MPGFKGHSPFSTLVGTPVGPLLAVLPNRASLGAVSNRTILTEIPPTDAPCDQVNSPTD